MEHPRQLCDAELDPREVSGGAMIQYDQSSAEVIVEKSIELFGAFPLPFEGVLRSWLLFPPSFVLALEELDLFLALDLGSKAPRYRLCHD